MNADLYRYWIGRPDQSVQESATMRRYNHQILVTEKCFTSFRFDEITDRMKKKYLKHELFMMFGISIIFTRLNRSAEKDADLDKMWQNCIAFDEKWGRYFRYRTPLVFICMPGKFGRSFTCAFYRFANKIVRFN